MALTKTVEEIEEQLPNFVGNLSDPAAFPNFGFTEYKYLVPITGIALYNDIHEKYNTAPGAMTAEEINLLKKMRLVSLCYAYHDSAALGHLKWTDTGTTKVQQTGTTEIRKWEYEKLENTFLNFAADATDILIGFLFEIENELWTDSDEYSAINSLLIKTGTDFTGQYNLFQPSRTFFTIRTTIADIQELRLNDAIGEDLLDYLVSIDEPDAKLKKEINKLKKALANLTIAMCVDHFTVRFSSEGFTVLMGNADSADHAGRQSASSVDLSANQNSCDKNGTLYLNKAIAGLITYYKRTEAPLASADFKTALDAGPLYKMINPESGESGNKDFKGIFRLG